MKLKQVSGGRSSANVRRPGRSPTWARGARWPEGQRLPRRVVVLSDNGKRPVRGTGKFMKELNRSRILECFLSGEALSRVDVAERTGISLPSVSHLVAELEAERML